MTTFIRETIHLAEVCNVLWLGAALFGIHVTWPYMSLLLELEANGVANGETPPEAI